MQQRAGAALMQSISEHASAAGFQTTAAFEGLSLTRRQTDVLALLLQGKPNKVIARELGVSVETIKDHVAAVLKALGVSSRTQAVLAVAQMSQRQGGHGFSAFRDDKP
jgi:DNA-binding NarL/FixJ family response regulator